MTAAQSTAAKRAAPTRQRETLNLPIMPSPMRVRLQNARTSRPMDKQRPKNVNSKVDQIPSLTCAQLIKNPGGRKTIRNSTVFGLEIANRCARPEAEETIRFANIVPVARQQLLQFQPLGT